MPNPIYGTPREPAPPPSNILVLMSIFTDIITQLNSTRNKSAALDRLDILLDQIALEKEVIQKK